MIYEERSISLKRGQIDAFVEHFRRSIQPAVTGAGGEVLCTLSAVIGDPPEELLQVSRYPDMERWEQVQQAYDESRMALVDSEEVREMKPVASRPKSAINADDLRPFYGHRRFFISPADLDEFVRHSEDGIWPRIEAQGASILGMWTPIGSTAPQEIVLLTGYRGPAHWENTRGTGPMPEGFDETVWERSLQARLGRSQLTVRSWVRLMRRLDI